jgi:iron complex transport system ATP-binding protein
MILLTLSQDRHVLDIAARTALLDTLERLSKTATGIIMVTHHPEDLIPSITHILLMDGGRVVAGGRKETITGKSNL